MGVADIHFSPEEICGEYRIFGRAAVQEDKERSLSTEICNEKIKEAIYHERLEVNEPRDNELYYKPFN